MAIDTPVKASTRTHARHNSSSSREPAKVSSILLSGNRPPGLHARDAREPTANSDAPTPAPIATVSPTNAQGQPNVAPRPDRRPPSIHPSEYAEATAQDSAESASPPRAQMPPPPPVSAPVPRARRMALDLPSSPIDVLYESDHKLALEGTSPKPCIVPGNALHLIDDDPSAPRSATPPSIIVVGDESEHGAEPETDIDIDGDGEGEGEGGYDDGEEAARRGGAAERSASQPPPASAVHPTPRVRFRSRVRITSGVHRHRHSATGGSTPGSSTSDSPSSSISAPLRYQADENAAWGPIGKRLSAYAVPGGWNRRTQQLGQGQGGQVNGNGTQQGPGGRVWSGTGSTRGHTERTPLIPPSTGRTMYSESEDEDLQEMGERERSMRAAALRREEEAVFGKWPWRIFNRHWWWWHVEPVLCCCCSDDSDYEEF